jgi:hypothetical protein
MEGHVQFFDQHRNDVASFEVTQKIDNNIAKLGRDESKFYMLSINPSGKEQKHIISQITDRRVESIEKLTRSERIQFEKKLKDYARGVMDGYARNFNRRIYDKHKVNEKAISDFKNSLNRFQENLTGKIEGISNKDLKKHTNDFRRQIDQITESKLDVKTINSFERPFLKELEKYNTAIQELAEKNKNLTQLQGEINKELVKISKGFDESFKRDMAGRDLLYFGQVEHTRKYTLEDAKRDIKQIKGPISRSEEDRLSNLIISRKEVVSKDTLSKIERTKDIRVAEIYSRIGREKEGLQSHVHIIVSRRDIDNKLKLSPFANARNANNQLDGRKVQIGFDRKKFVQITEKKFDQTFEYNRQYWDSFKHRLDSKKLLTRKVEKTFEQSVKNTLYRSSGFGKVGHTIEHASKIKDPLDAARLLVSQNAIAGNTLRAITNATNPYKMAIDIAKKLGKQIIQAGTL